MQEDAFPHPLTVALFEEPPRRSALTLARVTSPRQSARRFGLRPAGLEPTPPISSDGRFIQLSYGRYPAITR